MPVGFAVTTKPDFITISGQRVTSSPTGQASISTADLRPSEATCSYFEGRASADAAGHRRNFGRGVRGECAGRAVSDLCSNSKASKAVVAVALVAAGRSVF
jgi:hypothetical protein